MKVVITQSNYFPWKGYFDLVANADYCVFLDDVQFTKNDWRNRNRIKTTEGNLRWITVPVGKSISRKISEVELPKGDWVFQHERLFRENYSASPYFESARKLLEENLHAGFERLSELNQSVTRDITHRFINPSVTFLQDTEVIGKWGGYDRNERLIRILKEIRGSIYLSGPAASDYLDMNLFRKHAIEVRFADYRGYREYFQGPSAFKHDVSIIDLIAWTGQQAVDFLLTEKVLR